MASDIRAIPFSFPFWVTWDIEALCNLSGFGQKSEVILKVKKGFSHRDLGVEESLGSEQKFTLAVELAVSMWNRARIPGYTQTRSK